MPRALTEKLLFHAWKRPEHERELTVLRVSVRGRSGGETRRWVYDLYDQTDSVTGETSMARTTGFPCVIMARLLASGAYHEPGVRPPEMFASNEKVYETLVAELAARGVELRETRG